MKKVIILAMLTILLVPNVNALILRQNPQQEITISEDTDEGCVFEGHGDKYWYLWRESAVSFFDEILDSNPWVERCPTAEDISYNIKFREVDYFYVIAHSDGMSTRFRTDGPENHYTADQLHEDMINRPPIKLAILCCCEAMTDTGPGTLSYEFRKGQTEGTAVIGYSNLNEHKESGGDFSDFLDWQDTVFRYLNKGYTIKKAFDKACNILERSAPGFSNYVKFVGDEDLKVDGDFKVKTCRKSNQVPNIILNLLKFLGPKLSQIFVNRFDFL